MLNETSAYVEVGCDNGRGRPAFPQTKVIMTSIYIVIFLISVLGNGFVVFSLLVLNNKRHGRTAMEYFVLNLATTDFLFTTLSLIYGVEYVLDEWKLGVAACKIQGQLLEVTYTVSTLTLATISYSRYKAANAENPFRLLRQKPKVKRNIALIWLVSFIFNLPLFHAYTVVHRDCFRHCTNLNFNEVTRQTYYLVQAVLLFIVPITVMIVSQYKIRSALRWHSVTTGMANPANCVLALTAHGTTSSPISRRATISEQRITKILTWVWIIFTCCWAPFITYRTVDYFIHIRKNSEVWNQLWYLCQLLIILNAAIDPFLYHRMTKKDLGALTKVRCCIRRDRQVVSTSTCSN